MYKDYYGFQFKQFYCRRGNSYFILTFQILDCLHAFGSTDTNMLNNNLLKMPRLMHYLCNHYLQVRRSGWCLLAAVSSEICGWVAKFLTVNVTGISNTEYHDSRISRGK